jgi:molybdopterin-containing oxidoreductase family iron-sulfur binding subunit
MHLVPPGQEWIKVYQNRDNGMSGTYWFPRPCMQCDNPPCVKVCPVGATFKRADGPVLIDQERCIGCRYCVAACPYSARYFNWAEPPHTPQELAQTYSVETNIPHRRGVVEKCILCPQLLGKSKLAACAAGCPMGAIYVGDTLEDAVMNSKGETARLSTLLHEGAVYRYLEELGTEPCVYYLPPRNRAFPAPTGG